MIKTATIPFASLLTLLLITSCSSEKGQGENTSLSFKYEGRFEVPGRQGIASDGNFLYVSGSKSLYKLTPEGTVLDSNMTPFDGLQGDLNHLGDINLIGDDLYTGVESFVNGRGENIQIVIYDTDSLQPKRSIHWNEASGQKEVCGIAIDSVRGSIWLADWLDGQFIYRYDMVSGAYTGKVELKPPLSMIQGICAVGDQLLITADDGDADLDEPDHIYSIPLAWKNNETSRPVTMEKALTEFIRAGEIEGLCLIPRTNRLLVLMNRGKRILQGVPMEYYPGYDREIHEVYEYQLENTRN